MQDRLRPWRGPREPVSKYTTRIAASLACRERMARKLMAKEGKTEDRRRTAIVEPVFGQTKEARGFRRFHLRGRLKVPRSSGYSSCRPVEAGRPKT